MHPLLSICMLACAAVLPTCCIAAPVISGHVDGLNNRFSWEVYSDSAPDNPAPKAGELTYIYWQEAVGDSIPLYSLRLLDLTQFNSIPDLGTITATGFIPDTGAAPTDVSEAYWRWNNLAGIVLMPGERTASLYVRSPDGPGTVLASVFNCSPITCFPPALEVIGPLAAIPEPASMVLLCGALLAFVGKRPRRERRRK